MKVLYCNVYQFLFNCCKICYYDNSECNLNLHETNMYYSLFIYFSFEDFIHIFKKKYILAEDVFFIFINYFFIKDIKRFTDITRHSLLDINIMSLVIIIFKLYCVFLGTKTDFHFLIEVQKIV